MISISRVYGEIPAGYRVLADRLWPRGVKKENIDYWAKEIAPSNELRKWYGHIPERYEEFKEKYWAELDGNPETETLTAMCRGQDVVLLYAAKDEERNNAAVLKEWLESRPDIRIARISEMEIRLNRVRDWLNTGNGDVGDDICILEEYYHSSLWRLDFEADERGEIPSYVLRGVLSEDAIYNLLETIKEIKSDVGEML